MASVARAGVVRSTTSGYLFMSPIHTDSEGCDFPASDLTLAFSHSGYQEVGCKNREEEPIPQTACCLEEGIFERMKLKDEYYDKRPGVWAI